MPIDQAKNRGKWPDFGKGMRQTGDDMDQELVFDAYLCQKGYKRFFSGWANRQETKTRSTSGKAAKQGPSSIETLTHIFAKFGP